MKKLLILTLLFSINAYSHETTDVSPTIAYNKEQLRLAQEAAQRKAPRCDVGATGTGAFCTIVSKNVNRAAWSLRTKADSKIQRAVNRKIERILDKF